MSEFKSIRKSGFHQEDLVELAYYMYVEGASILNYLSTLGQYCSAAFGFMSDATTSYSISLSGSYGSLEISAKASFPTSITSITGVSVTLV